ncbi:hypothetical protein Tco_0487820 [Tanacetum coccineum]
MFSTTKLKQELLQTVREFHTCKQEEGQSVSSYVLKMKGYIDYLEQPRSTSELRAEFQYDGMGGMSVNETLHAMLKLHNEEDIACQRRRC